MTRHLFFLSNVSSVQYHSGVDSMSKEVGCTAYTQLRKCTQENKVRALRLCLHTICLCTVHMNVGFINLSVAQDYTFWIYKGIHMLVYT